MAKKLKEASVNLYYMNNNHVQKDTIDQMIEKKKIKEREKRIKANNKQKEDSFDLETEEVINMTNRNKIIKEQQRHQKIDKNKIRKQKKKKKIKRIVKWTSLLLLIAGAIVFAMTSPIFNIKNIEVIHNNKISSDTIISLSGLNIDQNIFRFNTSSVESNIKQEPYVDSVEVNRVFPNKVQIDVKEREVTFNIEFLGKYGYINNQGYILEISDEKQSLPILEGISTKEENIIPGNRLSNEDLIKLEVAIKIINVAKENNLDGKITSVNIQNEDEYSIYIEEEQKEVDLGDSSNLSYKMLWVYKLIEENEGKKGKIFVNGDLNKKFRPYFRETVEI